MATPSHTSDPAILRPSDARAAFDLRRDPPAAGLDGHVDWYWQVRWDLRGRPPYVSETLPHPCVHVVLEPEGLNVHGIVTRRFRRTLSGAGFALGTRFRPGAFVAVLGRPVAELTDRDVPLAAVLGADATALERALRDDEDDGARRERLDAFWLARLPAVADPAVALIAGLLDEEVRDPSPSVERMAARVGLSVRSLQRLFHRAVGASPKAVLMRHRLHAATERIAAGETGDWARLAAELGYADQAHFINDFRAVVGVTPGEYATACAS
jgi:AraC-like DNA-binding protein